MSDTIIAEEILKQLGGMRRLNAFMGAYNFVAVADGRGVSFRIKNRKVNYVKIVLNGKDLYDIQFGRIRGIDFKIVDERNDVYVDNLKKFVEAGTGMYLSFAKGGDIENAFNYKFNQAEEYLELDESVLEYLIGATPFVKSDFQKVEKNRYLLFFDNLGDISLDELAGILEAGEPVAVMAKGGSLNEDEEWVVYHDMYQKIAVKKSYRAAKMMMKKLIGNPYSSVGIVRKSEWDALGYDSFSDKITADDIVAGAKFKTSQGVVWEIDEVGQYDAKNGWTPVKTSMEGGEKNRYRDDLKEVVSFLNEQDAKKIMAHGGYTRKRF